MDKKCIVLLSGGLDSSTLLHYAKKTLKYNSVYALTFHYGQTHAIELNCAKWQANAAEVVQHNIIQLDSLRRIVKNASELTGESGDIRNFDQLTTEQRNQPPTYVPFRNLCFLSLSAAFGESNNIYDIFYGAQSQDQYGYWDATRRFVKRLNKVMALNRNKKLKVHAPFANMNKKDIIKLGTNIGVDYSHTWTCYKGKEKACGKCAACTDRLNAFKQAGIQDPASYEP
jgi:7-cyano-7-deazaguanine synthase